MASSTSVTWTALLTAWARARETRRPDALFADPLAHRFLTAYAGEFGADDDGGLPDLGPLSEHHSSPLWDYAIFGITMRTAVLDAAVRRSGQPQIVVLGAGLDTRPYRLGWSSEVTVFEVDRAVTLDFKAAVLSGAEPGCRRVPVVAELGVDDLPQLLKTAGFDAGRPTLWLAEAVLFYLTAARADALLDDVGALSAPGSGLLAETLQRPYREDDLPVGQLTEADAAMWRGLVAAFAGGPEVTDPAAWLTARGWAPGEITDQVAAGRAYGRPAPAFYEHVRDWIIEGHRA
ncbi:SAM-dependent methyltransferase [Actinoplanes sp. N902-109]|uniref:SAM-dependent methyltransferase n=1 Tax=Actinoplanes sp. (strain N902-109) TaxID=649831 RepID=UPI0003293C3E|nr:SAM-dependent methyltransferase [Actinoplanes sp. N902-109]AGL17366.1 putative S-adenosyl-L-methionine-dependent methyltransferase [Actinoplanes sp. N902-109]